MGVGLFGGGFQGGSRSASAPAASSPTRDVDWRIGFVVSA